MELKDLIKQSGKTRKQICEEAEISQGFLSLLESKQRSIGPNRVMKLAKALGVEPAAVRPDWAGLFTKTEKT